jgi:hypothetical protein
MKYFSLLVGICMASGLAVAQENVVTPRAEVGFNYTYFHGTTAQSTDFNQNGGSAYVEYNVNRVLGVVADFGGYANGGARRLATAAPRSAICSVLDSIGAGRDSFPTLSFYSAVPRPVSMDRLGRYRGMASPLQRAAGSM